MAVNALYLAQSEDNPVAGGYIQPGAGVTAAIVTLSDTGGVSLTGAAGTGSAAVLTVQGNASGTAIPVSGTVSVANETTATVQNGATASAPTAGTAVATLTTPAAGTYVISGTVSISGTTVAAADSNNFNLKKGATTLLTAIPIAVNSTTGAPGAYSFGPVTIALDGATSVTVNAVGNATGSSIYAAQVIGRKIA